MDRANRPISAYLDNNDYSYLTDPRREADFGVVREQLESLARQGTVQFFYSGSMLSEISPVRESDLLLAKKRGDLLSRLCGHQAMISFDRIFAGELDQLHGANIDPRLAWSLQGDWFPDVNEIMPSRVEKGDLLKGALENAISEKATNRKARRAVRSMAIGKRGIRRGVLPPFEAVEPPTETLPIRPEHYVVVGEYLAGRATRQQADEALKASLRDPAWIVLYLTSKGVSPTRLSEVIRKPAEIAIGKMVDSLDRVVDQLTQIQKANPSFEVPDEFWQRTWSEQIRTIAYRLDDKARPLSATHDAKTISKRCPGLRCFFGIAFELMRRRILGGKRQLVRNDFQDAIHAIYAPYVDVFRADGTTASMLRTHTKHYGTLVVDRLKHLPDALERASREIRRS